MRTTLAGTAAGLLATLPMTVTMKAVHRRLPWRQRREPIPPRQITMRAAEKVGVDQHLNAPARTAATMVSHFAYGAAAGLVYGALQAKMPGRPIAKGVLFGMTVWSGSYLGWLPAAGVLRPATRWPAGRNLMMILSHVVWGAATGLLTAGLVRLPSPKIR